MGGRVRRCLPPGDAARDQLRLLSRRYVPASPRCSTACAISVRQRGSRCSSSSSRPVSYARWCIQHSGTTQSGSSQPPSERGARWAGVSPFVCRHTTHAAPDDLRPLGLRGVHRPACSRVTAAVRGPRGVVACGGRAVSAARAVGRVSAAWCAAGVRVSCRLPVVARGGFAGVIAGRGPAFRWCLRRARRAAPRGLR